MSEDVQLVLSIKIDVQLEHYGLLGCNAIFGICLPIFHAHVMLTSSVVQCILQNVDVFLLDYTWPVAYPGIFFRGGGVFNKFS